MAPYIIDISRKIPDLFVFRFDEQSFPEAKPAEAAAVIAYQHQCRCRVFVLQAGGFRIPRLHGRIERTPLHHLGGVGNYYFSYRVFRVVPVYQRKIVLIREEREIILYCLKAGESCIKLPVHFRDARKTCIFCHKTTCKEKKGFELFWSIFLEYIPVYRSPPSKKVSEKYPVY